MKKIFGFAAVIAMVAVANVRMSSSNNEELTALQLENIEYLAEAESSMCSNGCLDQWGPGCFCYRYYENILTKVWTK